MDQIPKIGSHKSLKKNKEMKYSYDNVKNQLKLEMMATFPT